MNSTKAFPDEWAVLQQGESLGLLLRDLGAKVVTAESCTGGLVARALTETAGSSVWFERGHVTYSNEAKHECLGVSEQTLAAWGAVSEPVAAEMALGALRQTGVALALSVTGIAGPTGAVPGKPVGTVCFGWAVRGPRLTAADEPLIRTQTLHFEGDRAAVRRQSAMHAMAQAARLLGQEWADRAPIG